MSTACKIVVILNPFQKKLYTLFSDIKLIVKTLFKVKKEWPDAWKVEAVLLTQTEKYFILCEWGNWKVLHFIM